MFFYEDYRLVLLRSQQAFMMAVTGTRIWVWNKPCCFLPGCEVYSGDQTYVLLTPICYSVSGMRGGGHIPTQAGMAAEGSVSRHEGILTSSCNFHLLLLLFLKAKGIKGYRSGLLGVMWCAVMVDSVVMLPHTMYGEGIELVGGDVRNREACVQLLQEQGQVKGHRGLIGKRKGCSKSWNWHYWCGRGRTWLWGGSKRCFFAIWFYDSVLEVNTVSLGTNPSRLRVINLADREVWELYFTAF